MMRIISSELVRENRKNQAKYHGIYLLKIFVLLITSKAQGELEELGLKIIFVFATGYFMITNFCVYGLPINTINGGYAILGSTRSMDDDVTGNHGSMDFWIVKLGMTITLVPGPKNGDGIEVFPNPSYGVLNLKLPSSYCGAKVSLFDPVGKEVYKNVTVGYDPVLYLPNICAGIYFLKITTDNNETAYKVLNFIN
jgi:hypothetical protein